MPKMVTKKATITKFDGEDLKVPINFNYTYPELQDGELDSVKDALAAIKWPAVVEAKEVITVSDLVSVINANRNAKERARRQAQELENNGIKRKELADNPRLRYMNMFRSLTVGADAWTAEEADAFIRTRVKDYTGPIGVVEAPETPAPTPDAPTA